jgi:D-alanine---D-serine ligase
MDKDMAHRLVYLAGINTPTSTVLYSPISESEFSKQTAYLKYPLFVKPANAGSSFGITKVSDQSGLANAVKVAFQHDRKIIVEEAVDGFEVGCAILGNETLTIGEVDEIELSQGFFDYTEKYTPNSSRIHMPARIDASTADRVKQAAAVIYRTLGCKGYARVDIFLSSDNEIIFNEINTIPGFTSHSRYPNMLKGIGMTFQHIVDELIRLAMQP